jgi:hypothetical protein
MLSALSVVKGRERTILESFKVEVVYILELKGL